MELRSSRERWRLDKALTQVSSPRAVLLAPSPPSSSTDLPFSIQEVVETPASTSQAYGSYGGSSSSYNFRRTDARCLER